MLDGAFAGGRKRSAFLDHLLELAESENLSDDDIREEVDTIMFEVRASSFLNTN